MSYEHVLLKKDYFLQAENKSHPTISDSAFVTRVHTALAQTMYTLLHFCALYVSCANNLCSGQIHTLNRHNYITFHYSLGFKKYGNMNNQYEVQKIKKVKYIFFNTYSMFAQTVES